jgi:hypothetical protein
MSQRALGNESKASFQMIYALNSHMGTVPLGTNQIEQQRALFWSHCCVGEKALNKQCLMSNCTARGSILSRNPCRKENRHQRQQLSECLVVRSREKVTM